jgi:hypothetical protein
MSLALMKSVGVTIVQLWRSALWSYRPANARESQATEDQLAEGIGSHVTTTPASKS